ncbi:hypothetical protein [Caenimonas koreensis]|uniref:hypothetical protein n=1 Tax=Caenimonas koreensis TaxID=367474 RepID=UPI0037837CF7
METTTTFHMPRAGTVGTTAPRRVPEREQRPPLVISTGPTKPAIVDQTMNLPLRPAFALSSSVGAGQVEQSHPLSEVPIDIGPAAQQPGEPAGPWQSIRNVCLLGTGVVLKTVGGVYASRQIAGVCGNGLMKLHLAFLPEDDPIKETIYSTLVIATYAVAITVVCAKFISPMTSAMLTYLGKDDLGRDEIVRRGGSMHQPLVLAISLMPAMANIGRAVLNGLDQPEGAARNLVVMACFTGAVRTIIFGVLRGIFERPGARLMPSRTIVDAQGTPVPADEVTRLNKRRVRYQLPLTLAANTWVVSSILLVPFGDDPLSEMAGVKGGYVSVWIGLYEAIVAFGDIAATAAAAHHEGWSMQLGRQELAPGEPQAADAMAEAAAAAAQIPAGLKAKAEDVVKSVELDEWRSKLKSMLRRPTPDIYMIVTGLRNFINLHLNLTLDPHVVGALDPGRIPFLTIGLHASILAWVEVSPVLLEGGIAAIASEGRGDREMFDKLHHLFKLQDLLHVQMHQAPHPDAGIAIIRRELNPAMLGIIEGNPTFDDVREHLAALKRSGQPRRAAADPVTDFVLYEPTYPTTAMKKEFGHVTSSEPFLPDSHITSHIGQYIGELVNDNAVPPPPPEGA